MGILFSSHFGKTDLRSDVVETDSGPVVGKRFDLGKEKFADAFLGIPFAKPPVDELRFKKPEPPEKWFFARHCFEHGPRSMQRPIIFEKLSPYIPSSEDCLYLNVFAPNWPLPNDQPNGRAVMVFIHGGGFAIHSSANYGDFNICQYLCIKEVVVVTIQYRLGILGFSATGDENSIPNLGLWDQACALQWVKTNIKNFNGNPDNITVFGQSAGGVSVDMLCLSPYTNNLFSKVIPMAGTASCPWSTRPISSIRKSLVEHAESIGWKEPKHLGGSEVNKKLMEFLMLQPAKKLGVGMDLEITEKDPYSMAFVPIIDGDFLPESISELRKKAPKKLCMTGTCEYEGLLFDRRLLFQQANIDARVLDGIELDKKIVELNAGLAKKEYGMKRREKIIPFFINESKYNNIGSWREEAKRIYFSDNQTKEEADRAHVKLLGDIFINNGVQNFAHDMTLAGHTVYLYSFLHFNPKALGIIRYFLPFQAATHASELPFLFGKSPQGSFSMTIADMKICDQFTTFFTNFAKYGDPNGVGKEKIWLPLTSENTYRYLSIDTEAIEMKEDYEDRASEFWRFVKADAK